MYSLETIEDTIRIPAEYIEKGKSLSEHVDRLAATAFEGKFDDDGNIWAGSREPGGGIVKLSLIHI